MNYDDYIYIHTYKKLRKMYIILIILRSFLKF